MEPINRRKFLKTNAVLGAGAIAGLSSFGTLSHAVGDIDKPALLGGTPIRTAAWPKWPQWDKDKDEELILKVLRSGVWSRDKVVEEFETKWAETLGVKRCLTVVNGTNAIIAALVQSKIGGGDEVIVSSYTFKMYKKKDLDFQAFIAKNQCPETDLLCNETGVWLYQNMLLGTKKDMDDIADAIQKIHDNAERLLQVTA